MIKRKVEIYSAGCEFCQDVIERVKMLSCPSCEIEIHDMQDPVIAGRAKTLGLLSVPTVLVDGLVVDSDEPSLRSAGIGSPK